MGEIRDRLKSRKRPTATCRIRVDDTTEAEAELKKVLTEIGIITSRGEDVEESLLSQAQQASEALESCYVSVTLSALPLEDLEALIAENPPKEDGKDRWNPDTFPRACFLACAPDVLTSEEWEEFLDKQCSDGERFELYAAAVAVNERAPRGLLPKALRATIYSS